MNKTENGGQVKEKAGTKKSVPKHTGLNGYSFIASSDGIGAAPPASSFFFLDPETMSSIRSSRIAVYKQRHRYGICSLVQDDIKFER